jgi:hypothetical protein
MGDMETGRAFPISGNPLLVFFPCEEEVRKEEGVLQPFALVGGGFV